MLKEIIKINNSTKQKAWSSKNAIIQGHTNYIMDTPILLLIFNRPDTTAKVFEEIRKARPKQLFIASDGPRDNVPGDQVLCAETKSIVKNIDWECEVKTLFREKKPGLQKCCQLLDYLVF
ncbi:MAG: hypothetical protein M0P64_02540 [Candidatus Pacebacteria bacterium]|nr:hypothetical protein [Candidatus Paceibacterota bacterium]